MRGARSKIVNALVGKLKLIDGSAPYETNLFTNVTNKLKFWDEVNDFPYLCVIAGSESREYLPSMQRWGFLNIAIKVYVKGENPQDDLESVLADIEECIRLNEVLEYEAGKFCTEILVTGIITDEGLLAPFGVGEITLQVRYDLSYTN